MVRNLLGRAFDRAAALGRLLLDRADVLARNVALFFFIFFSSHPKCKVVLFPRFPLTSFLGRLLARARLSNIRYYWFLGDARNLDQTEVRRACAYTCRHGFVLP